MERSAKQEMLNKIDALIEAQIMAVDSHQKIFYIADDMMKLEKAAKALKHLVEARTMLEGVASY